MVPKQGQFCPQDTSGSAWKRLVVTTVGEMLLASSKQRRVLLNHHNKESSGPRVSAKAEMCWPRVEVSSPSCMLKSPELSKTLVPRQYPRLMKLESWGTELGHSPFLKAPVDSKVEGLWPKSGYSSLTTTSRSGTWEMHQGHNCRPESHLPPKDPGSYWPARSPLPP